MCTEAHNGNDAAILELPQQSLTRPKPHPILTGQTLNSPFYPS
jgi:hypothetical protein